MTSDYVDAALFALPRRLGRGCWEAVEDRDAYCFMATLEEVRPDGTSIYDRI